MDKFASICVVSYQRLDYLKRTMESLTSVNSGFPMEIIVHDDGSDQKVKEYLYELQREGKISYLIMNNGKNRGIGHAIRRCFKISSGDYLFKCDTDIEFKEGWLKTAVDILEYNWTVKNPVGCVSLLDYNNYNASDERFKTEQTLVGLGVTAKIVTDFISCLYGVKRDVYEYYKNELGTDGWHQHIKKHGFSLAISDTDMIDNFGFGLGKSIYIEENNKGEIVTTKTHDEPLIFKNDSNS